MVCIIVASYILVKPDVSMPLYRGPLSASADYSISLTAHTLPTRMTKEVYPFFLYYTRRHSGACNKASFAKPPSPLSSSPSLA